MGSRALSKTIQPELVNASAVVSQPSNSFKIIRKSARQNPHLMERLSVLRKSFQMDSPLLMLSRSFAFFRLSEPMVSLLVSFFNLGKRAWYLSHYCQFLVQIDFQ